jgi:hypothetical protein
MTTRDRTWEYFAGLAFAYYDAPQGTDDVDAAWHELAGAIRHYRGLGGADPRDPDEIRPDAVWAADAQLRRLVADMLSRFTQAGHPDERHHRTPWIDDDTIAEWHRIYREASA